MSSRSLPCVVQLVTYTVNTNIWICSAVPRLWFSSHNSLRFTRKCQYSLSTNMHYHIMSYSSAEFHADDRDIGKYNKIKKNW